MLHHGVNPSVRQKDSEPTSDVPDQSSMATERSTSLSEVYRCTVMALSEFEPEYPRVL